MVASEIVPRAWHQRGEPGDKVLGTEQDVGGAVADLVTTYTSTWQGFALSAYGYPITIALAASIGLIAIALLAWLGVRGRDTSASARRRRQRDVGVG